jgi:hypothetical protein
MAVIKSKPPKVQPVSPTNETTLHKKLVAKGATWLRKQGCGVVITDSIQAITRNGERPDVIGWRENVSILLECKASRADFLKDFAKPFREDPAKGVGDWRFYLCPENIIKPDELPDGWGLLLFNGRSVVVAAGVPGNTGWFTEMPFTADKHSENAILASALRRYQRVYGKHALERSEK